MRTDKAEEHPPGLGNVCEDEEKKTGTSLIQSRVYSCTVGQQNTHRIHVKVGVMLVLTEHKVKPAGSKRLKKGKRGGFCLKGTAEKHGDVGEERSFQHIVIILHYKIWQVLYYQKRRSTSCHPPLLARACGCSS